ncbi:hypothetical protein [Lacinutrix cladophorae]
MKTLLITLVTIVSLSFSNIQDTSTVHATFDGIENEAYYFSDDEDTVHVFDTVSEEVTKTFDLTDEKYNGMKFKITYSTETIIDEMEDEIIMLTIVNLETLTK